jgi:hypothetical protein
MIRVTCWISGSSHHILARALFSSATTDVLAQGLRAMQEVGASIRSGLFYCLDDGGITDKTELIQSIALIGNGAPAG